MGVTARMLLGCVTVFPRIQSRNEATFSVINVVVALEERNTQAFSGKREG